MKKMLNFSLSIILALSLASGNITGSAHVGENRGHSDYQQPIQPGMGSQPGDDHRPSDNQQYKYDQKFGYDQKPCNGKATATPTVCPIGVLEKTPIGHTVGANRGASGIYGTGNTDSYFLRVTI